MYRLQRHENLFANGFLQNSMLQENLGLKRAIVRMFEKKVLLEQCLEHKSI